EQRHRRALADRTVHGDRMSTIVHGIGARGHIARNLGVIEETIHAAASIVGINLPVGLIAPGRVSNVLVASATPSADDPKSHAIFARSCWDQSL
ncbi:hypothetical protein ACFTXM_26210, partial [Streptomyces sp. NPDC056930]|uniref:hypothetical protein n=1 Tax=Streptomyces sp. NPDC056930 TaxID=3345967 RepID=UPI00363B7C80